jgi:hypothetical protein
MLSGIITAALGSVLGIAVAHVGQQDFNDLKYESKIYQDLNDYYALIGAGLGLIVGSSQECIRELKAQRDKELEKR